MKEKVSLLFPTLHHLWSFTQSAKINSVEIITSECMLICDCKGADIELAQEQYGATLSMGQPQR